MITNEITNYNENSDSFKDHSFSSKHFISKSDGKLSFFKQNMRRKTLCKDNIEIISIDDLSSDETKVDSDTSNSETVTWVCSELEQSMLTSGELKEEYANVKSYQLPKVEDKFRKIVDIIPMPDFLRE